MITRIITALIGLPVFLGLFYLGGYYTDLLVFAMIITGIIELFKIFNITDKIVLYLLFIFSFVSIISGEIVYIFELSIILILLLFIIYVKKFKDNHEENIKFFNIITKSIFSFFYVTVPLFHLILMRNMENGFNYILFMFALIWATDSFAYFTGMAFGKNKLAPVISPKKTIEGSVGGSLCALVLSLILNYKLDIFPEVSLGVLFLIVLALTIISQVGDLFESSIKRIYNVKDSGKILPGHGGVLDRFDSTIFTAPVFYILLKYFVS